MEITVYRLVKNRHIASAFDGEGARTYGGRWNSPGVPVVYTSESLALCCLEIFVHLPSYKLLDDYVFITATFSQKFILSAELVDGWNARPVSKASQSMGDRWIAESKFPVLKVPSVIIPGGSNYLLNITHPNFKSIKIGEPSPIAFDPRFHK